MTVERGGWYGEGGGRSRGLQSHGEKGEGWRICVVLGRGRRSRGNRPAVASGSLVTKTRNRKGRHT